MRRLAISLAVVTALAASGCSLSDMLYNMFGGMTSNDTDMNRIDGRNTIKPASSDKL